MIKITQGSIGTKDGGWVPIVAKSAFPNKFKDLLIGSSIVLVGVTYLTYTAFKNGVDAMDKAEFKTLCDCGYIDNPEGKTSW